MTAYQRQGDSGAHGRLCRWLAVAEWDRGHFEKAQSHLTAGLEALAGQPPSQELADLIHTHVVFVGRLGDALGLEAAAAELLAVAGQLSSPRAQAQALLAQASASFTRGAAAVACEQALRALSVSEEADEPLLAQRAHDTLSLAAWVSGDYRLTLAHAEHSLALARRVQTPTLELLPRMRMIHAHLAGGAWDDAQQLSTDTLALARRVGQPRGVAGIMTMQATLLAQRGELDVAEAGVAEARRIFGTESASDRNISGVLDMAEVTVALERGDAAGALAKTDAWGAFGAFSSLALGYKAEAQVAAGQAERALQTARALADKSRAGNPLLAALAAHAEGRARQALGQADDAQACFARAIEAFAALEMPFETARARLEWAAVTAATQPEAAAAAAQESLAVFERLGARLYARRARQLLHRLGVHPPAAARPKSGSGLLSAREVEVARLVADGLSTPEIARRLVISPRTVTTHLDRIYARLSLNSRAALARYVAETGLLPAAGQDT